MALLHEPDTELTLDIDAPPQTVMLRLEAEMALVRSVVWSPAWGEEDPFVGVVSNDAVHMRVRHGYSNGFTRILYGHVEPWGEGTRLHLRFRSVWWIEALMRGVWVLLALPLGLYLADLLRHGFFDLPKLLMAVGVPLGTLGLLAGIEWFGRMLGDRDEQTMRAAIRGWFDAAPDPDPQPS
jgi:hypothetical protein